MPVALDQLAVALGLFERVEVLALDVLDQRQLGGRQFIDVADDRRDRMEPRPLRRPPATLAGDDQIAVVVGPKQDRLEHAALADRFCEFVERLLVELHPRLIGVGPNPGNLDLPHTPARMRPVRSGRSGRPRRLPKERLQTHAEPFRGAFGAHAATASCGSRPMSSRARRR